MIWYYTVDNSETGIIVYIDDEMKTEEIKDYLLRTTSLPDEYNIEEFHEKQYRFGTIALMHNLVESPENVFVDYKSRMRIEILIDALKNVLEADSSYMHNEHSLEAWMFINFLSLHWYYRILNILKESKLNKIYSPMDFLKFLREIKKVKINENWYLHELTKKYSDILSKAGIHIT